MLEKVMYIGLAALVSLIGYLLNRTLNGIEGTQKEHTKSLRVASDRIVRLEEKHTFVGQQIDNIEKKMDKSFSVENEIRQEFSENMQKLQVEVHSLTAVQKEQSQNYGKVFMIVQKLYAQLVELKKEKSNSDS